MNVEFWKNLGLTEGEINVLDFVNKSSVVSQRAHLRGEELKDIDRNSAEVANTSLYRSALNKIHEAEMQTSGADF